MLLMRSRIGRWAILAHNDCKHLLHMLLPPTTPPRVFNIKFGGQESSVHYVTGSAPLTETGVVSDHVEVLRWKNGRVGQESVLA